MVLIIFLVVNKSVIFSGCKVLQCYLWDLAFLLFYIVVKLDSKKMHKTTQTLTDRLNGEPSSRTVYSLTDTDQNSNKLIEKCDSIVIEEIVSSLRKRAAMNHLKKNQNLLRRVSRTSRGKQL